MDTKKFLVNRFKNADKADSLYRIRAQINGQLNFDGRQVIIDDNEEHFWIMAFNNDDEQAGELLAFRFKGDIIKGEYEIRPDNKAVVRAQFYGASSGELAESGRINILAQFTRRREIGEANFNFVSKRSDAEMDDVVGRFYQKPEDAN